MRIQNLLQDKDENLYGLSLQHLAPPVNILPQKSALGSDYIYEQNTALTMKGKFPPQIYVNFTRRLMKETVLEEVQDEEVE